MDCDAGVVPCSRLPPRARALDQRVLRVVAAASDESVEEALADEEVEQVGLPVRFAGLGVDMPSHVAAPVRAARLVEGGPAVRAAVAP